MTKAILILVALLVAQQIPGACWAETVDVTANPGIAAPGSGPEQPTAGQGLLPTSTITNFEGVNVDLSSEVSLIKAQIQAPVQIQVGGAL